MMNGGQSDKTVNFCENVEHEVEHDSMVFDSVSQFNDKLSSSMTVMDSHHMIDRKSVILLLEPTNLHIASRHTLMKKFFGKLFSNWLWENFMKSRMNALWALLSTLIGFTITALLLTDKVSSVVIGVLSLVFIPHPVLCALYNNIDAFKATFAHFMPWWMLFNLTLMVVTLGILLGDIRIIFCIAFFIVAFQDIACDSWSKVGQGVRRTYHVCLALESFILFMGLILDLIPVHNDDNDVIVEVFGFRWSTRAMCVSSSLTLAVFALKNVYFSIRYPKCFLYINQAVRKVSSDEGSSFRMSSMGNITTLVQGPTKSSTVHTLQPIKQYVWLLGCNIYGHTLGSRLLPESVYSRMSAFFRKYFLVLVFVSCSSLILGTIGMLIRDEVGDWLAVCSLVSNAFYAMNLFRGNLMILKFIAVSFEHWYLCILSQSAALLYMDMIGWTIRVCYVQMLGIGILHVFIIDFWMTRRLGSLIIYHLMALVVLVLNVVYLYFDLLPQQTTRTFRFGNLRLSSKTMYFSLCLQFTIFTSRSLVSLVRKPHHLSMLRCRIINPLL